MAWPKRLYIFFHFTSLVTVDNTDRSKPDNLDSIQRYTFELKAPAARIDH